MQGANPSSFPPPQGREQYLGGPPPPGVQQQYTQQFQQPGGIDQQPKAPMQSPQPAYPPPIQQTGSMPPQQFVSQQPVGAPQMVIYQGGSGGNRNALNKPFNPQGRREWSFGLCGCFDECGTCLFSWCCPCFSFGKNMSRFQYLESQGRAHPSGGDMCNSDCCVYLALMYCGMLLFSLSPFVIYNSLIRPNTHVHRLSMHFWYGRKE